MLEKLGAVAALCIALALAGCGGGGGDGTIVNDTKGTVRLESLIHVPNVGVGTNFSFDLGDVDSANNRYYFTDRNNKSVDVFDTRTNMLVAQITGFTGTGASSEQSGPDGLNVIPNSNFIYVGDVNTVKIIDKRTNQITKTITVSTSGLRADEGCFDADDNIYMIGSPGESPPFATFISTVSQTVIAKLIFADSAGVEQCAYDPGTKSFLVNNDGTKANAHGEVDVIPAASVVAGNPVVSAAYPLGNCDPTGLALGPGVDVAVECRPGAGSALNFQILDRTNGKVLGVVNAGGGDQITYDPVSNRYYVAENRFNATGLAVAACTAATPCTPSLAIVDAKTRTLIGRIAAGNNAHSVAVDGPNRRIYVPFSSVTAPAGCGVGCDLFGSGEGGVAVYSISGS